MASNLHSLKPTTASGRQKVNGSLLIISLSGQVQPLDEHFSWGQASVADDSRAVATTLHAHILKLAVLASTEAAEIGHMSSIGRF